MTKGLEKVRAYRPANTGFYNFRDLTGQRFGRLEVIKLLGVAGVQTFWECRCDCGKTAEVGRAPLVSGQTRSCGCLKRELTLERTVTHGMAKQLIYKRWCNMIQRCTNPKHPKYPNYGGRGIKVCERWLNSFEAYYADMGDPPPGSSIDRQDNDGDYEPDNCYWAMNVEQANNRTTNRTVEYKGNFYTLAQLAKLASVSYQTLWDRLKQGWSIADAVEKPAKITSPTPDRPTTDTPQLEVTP